jgi:hypothetical protein
MFSFKINPCKGQIILISRFEALFNNEYIDLDNLDKEEKNEQVVQKPASVPAQKEVKKEETINNKIVEKPIPQKDVLPRIKEESVSGVSKRRERSEISAELLEKIAQKRKQQALPKQESVSANKEIKKEVANTVKDLKCILDGESYNVLSSVKLTEKIGCHLAKNSKGYTVLGYVDEQLCVLKQYNELKSEKIQARKSDDLADGFANYIIRIGISKFIVKVNLEKIEFVMDLC